MRPNLSLGDVVIEHESGAYMLRPTFVNTQRLIDEGYDPADCLSAIHSDMSTIEDPRFKSGFSLSTAIAVLQAYCETDLPPHITGSYEFARTREGLVFRPGLMHWEDVLLFAFHMLIHALIGKPGEDKKKKSGPSDEKFNPAQFVGLIVAHLGSAQESAWNMTMIEFQRSWDAKFPDQAAVGGKKRTVAPMSEDQLRSLKHRVKDALARNKARKEASNVS